MPANEDDLLLRVGQDRRAIDERTLRFVRLGAAGAEQLRAIAAAV